MECSVRIRRQLVELFKYRELLGLECVATRAEGIKRLPVTEKDSLLTFVYYELRAKVEVLDRVLPDNGIVVALIFYDTCKPVLFYSLLRELFLYIVHAITDGTGICCSIFRSDKLYAALSAGKFLHPGHIGLLVYFLPTDGAKRAVAFGLIEHDLISAVGAFAACELIGFYFKGITAAAGYLPCAEQTRTKQP